MKQKVIKIAVPQDFAPFGSAGADLKPIGYDIDMANLIGRTLGVKVELVPVDSANRIPYLQTRKVDLVISSLGKNPEREKVIDFSKAYAPFFQGVSGSRTPRSRNLEIWPPRRSARLGVPSRSRRSPS
jgi:polar amino acid transport system substrate-binding protein